VNVGGDNHGYHHWIVLKPVPTSGENRLPPLDRTVIIIFIFSFKKA
jgi:hypothetical protein